MSENITSAQMGKSKIRSNLSALCSFATPRTTYRHKLTDESCDYKALNHLLVNSNLAWIDTNLLCKFVGWFFALYDWGKSEGKVVVGVYAPSYRKR
jgi:hypothetical protein